MQATHPPALTGGNPAHTAIEAAATHRALSRSDAPTPGTQRYQLAGLSRRVAVLFTKTYGRVLAPGLSALDPRLPVDVSARSSLSTACRGFEKALDDYLEV